MLKFWGDFWIQKYAFDRVILFDFLGPKKMNSILIILHILIAPALCVENRAADFVSKLLQKNANNVVYVLMDCELRNHESAVAIFGEVKKNFQNLKTNVITIPLNANGKSNFYKFL